MPVVRSVNTGYLANSGGWVAMNTRVWLFTLANLMFCHNFAPPKVDCLPCLDSSRDTDAVDCRAKVVIRIVQRSSVVRLCYSYRHAKQACGVR
jgi:hypothetical protein